MERHLPITQSHVLNQSMTTQEGIMMNQSLPVPNNVVMPPEYYLQGFRQSQDVDNDLQTRNAIRQTLPEKASYHMEVIQQPVQAEATESVSNSPRTKINNPEKRKKTDWGLEPMPVIEITESSRSNKVLNIHPQMFLFARLHPESDPDRQGPEADGLCGNRVASVFRVKSDGKISEQGVFYFPELHLKYPGKYFLHFTLYEIVMDTTGASHTMPCGATCSNVFTILPKGQKLPPPSSPTKFNILLDSCGAKIRYRKPGKPKTKKEEGWSARLSDVNQDSVGKQLSSRTKRRKSHSGNRLEETIQRQPRRSLTDSSTGYSDFTAPLPPPGAMQPPRIETGAQHIFVPGQISPSNSFSFGPTQRSFQAGMGPSYIIPHSQHDPYVQNLDVSSSDNQYRTIAGPQLPIPQISQVPSLSGVSSIPQIPPFQSEPEFSSNHQLLGNNQFHQGQHYHTALQFPPSHDYQGVPQFPAGHQFSEVQNFEDQQFQDPNYDPNYQDQQPNENYQNDQYNQQ